MDTMWFEQRKQTLRRLGYLNIALFIAFFVAYMVAREASDVVRIYSGSKGTLEQLHRFQDAAARAQVSFGFAVFFAIAGLASFVHRLRLRGEYNARILAADPLLRGDFIPSLK